MELVCATTADGQTTDQAFNSTDCGILMTDSKGIIKHETRSRLGKAYQRVKAADRRDWLALHHVRPAAERFCTADYQTAAIFELFGGEVVITKFGPERYGWNNAQPLDIRYSDCYDLAKAAGRGLMYVVLEKQWPFLTVLAFPCTVWSVMNNLKDHTDRVPKAEGKEDLVVGGSGLPDLD